MAVNNTQPSVEDQERENIKCGAMFAAMMGAGMVTFVIVMFPVPVEFKLSPVHFLAALVVGAALSAALLWVIATHWPEAKREKSSEGGFEMK